MDKKLTQRIFIFIILCAGMYFGTSCSHTYYHAPSHNVPLFKEKNEFSLLVSDISQIVNEVEVQGAYSVTDEAAIAANLMIRPGIQYFDLAGGFYKPMGDEYIFEIFGGGGIYNQNHSYTDMEYNSNLNILIPVQYGSANITSFRSYIQPSWGVTGEIIDMAISPRVSYFNIYSVENNITDTIVGTYGYDQSRIVNLMEAKRHYLFFEPAATMRVGWKYIKIQVQYSYTLPLGYCNFDYSASNLSFGVYFNFSRAYFDRKKV
ncbi:MAG: hypothetical protein C0596_17930 [Marinilabiliales bacterium]|nr:MAG: hypothetical protein C0596_17930 [Marinilabiliales bacterium]